MHVIVWQLFGLFDGVGMKKHCLTFFDTSGSVTAVGLKLRAFLGTKCPLFSATVPFSMIQAALQSK